VNLKRSWVISLERIAEEGARLSAPPSSPGLGPPEFKKGKLKKKKTKKQSKELHKRHLISQQPL